MGRGFLPLHPGSRAVQAFSRPAMARGAYTNPAPRPAALAYAARHPGPSKDKIRKVRGPNPGLGWDGLQASHGLDRPRISLHSMPLAPPRGTVNRHASRRCDRASVDNKLVRRFVQSSYHLRGDAQLWVRPLYRMDHPQRSDAELSEARIDRDGRREPRRNSRHHPEISGAPEIRGVKERQGPGRCGRARI